MAKSFIKNVLYPTDFSDNARNALPFALEIVKHSDATLHLIHSIEEPYDFAPMAEEIMKGVTHKVQRLFDEMIEDIRKKKPYEAVNIKTHIRSGRPVYSILEESRELHIDLVVMGTQGRSGIQRVLFGSNSAEIVQQSKIPVLCIPQDASFKGFKEILFTTDYNDRDMEALTYVTEFGKLFDSKIKVFHASPDKSLKTEIMFRGFRELVRDKLSFPDISFEQDTSVSFFDAVADQIIKKKISLLVMIRYKKPLAILGKKHSKEMSYYSQAPLLVLPVANHIL